jgi:hypothetical protein
VFEIREVVNVFLIARRNKSYRRSIYSNKHIFVTDRGLLYYYNKVTRLYCHKIEATEL